MNRTDKKYRLETLAVHAGHQIDEATGAVTEPIYLSTSFERDLDGGYERGYMYGRNRNPNRVALENALAALEGAAIGAAFSSGVAATTAIFQNLAPGDHVIAPMDGYYGTANVLNHLFAKWGIQASFVDMTQIDAVRESLRPETRIIWVETPSNPLMRCADIAALAELSRAHGARLVADNTFASPLMQHPLELGCDLVAYSTTKYIGGRGDVLGGMVLSRLNDEHFSKIRAAQAFGGAVPSPFDCWLLMRSLPTLPQRMRAHCANAQRLAEFLEGDSLVTVVHYPGLQSNPYHALAKRQMSSFGGMLSFEIKGGKDAAMALASEVQLFTRATSFGGVESLIEHHASIAGTLSKVPQGLLRISAGIEHIDDLIDDLSSALDRVRGRRNV